MSISLYFSALCQWQDDGWSRGPRLSGGVLENFMEVWKQKWDKTMKMPTFGHVVHMQAYNVHDYIWYNEYTHNIHVCDIHIHIYIISHHMNLSICAWTLQNNFWQKNHMHSEGSHDFPKSPPLPVFRSFEATFGQGFRFMVRDPRNTKAQGWMFSGGESWPVSVGEEIVVWLVRFGWFVLVALILFGYRKWVM